jgi:hypothetical protein
VKRTSTKPKDRTAQGAKRKQITEAFIPVTVQNEFGDDNEFGTAEIEVAVQGNSDSAPGTVIGKAEIPVTMNQLRKPSKGRRGRKNDTDAVVKVLPVASNRSRPRISPKAKSAVPPVSLDERRRARAMRDPIVRTIHTAIDVEQGIVSIAGQFGLAAIAAAESVVKFLLPSPAQTQRAVDAAEEVLPWPLDAAVERVAEWPGEERAA